MAKKYRTKSGKVEEKLPGINATVSPSEKVQIAMAGGADTLKDVQTILGQQGKRNNLKGQGAKHIVSFDHGEEAGEGSSFSPDPDTGGFGGYGGGGLGPTSGYDVDAGSYTDFKGDTWGGKFGGKWGGDTEPPSKKKGTGPSNIYDPGLGAPGDRRGMGVYGMVNGQLSWLGTEGFGDPESLGDISQWGFSDYTRGGKPSSLAGKGDVSKEERAKNLEAAKQPGSLTNQREKDFIGPLAPSYARNAIQAQMKKDAPGLFGSLLGSATKPWSAARTEKAVLSAAFGPLGTIFGFFQGRGINEPPGIPAKQPFTYARLSQGTLGNKALGIPDQPGPANMQDPKGYSRFSPVDGGDDTPKKKLKLFRAASNNANLAIADSDDPTRKDLRRARRQITRFA